MSLSVDVETENVRSPVARDRIADASRMVLRAERVREALLSITLVSRSAIARLNKKHLDHPGPTDVISFGFTRPSPNDPVVGDIYICPEVARANARARGVGVREEILRLAVHGTLHVLGHDHPEDEGREHSAMWKRQEKLLKKVLGPV